MKRRSDLWAIWAPLALILVAALVGLLLWRVLGARYLGF
jgi:hypothetical protein